MPAPLARRRPAAPGRRNGVRLYAIRIYSGSPRENRSMRDLGDIDAYPRRSLVHGIETARRPGRQSLRHGEN